MVNHHQPEREGCCIQQTHIAVSQQTRQCLTPTSLPGGQSTPKRPLLGGRHGVALLHARLPPSGACTWLFQTVQAQEKFTGCALPGGENKEPGREGSHLFLTISVTMACLPPSLSPLTSSLLLLYYQISTKGSLPQGGQESFGEQPANTALPASQRQNFFSWGKRDWHYSSWDCCQGGAVRPEGPSQQALGSAQVLQGEARLPHSIYFGRVPILFGLDKAYMQHIPLGLSPPPMLSRPLTEHF